MSFQQRRCCFFCPREAALIWVQYGGGHIWICLPCVERSVESEDEGEEEHDEEGPDDEHEASECRTTTGGERSDESVDE